MRLGIRGHDISESGMESLIQGATENKIECIQLALKKTFPTLNLNTTKVTTGLMKSIQKPLEKADIEVAVLGCYINMSHPDKKIRQQELDYFKAHLRHVADIGGRIVASETGSVLPEGGYTTENFSEESFQIVVESVKELVTEAAKFGAIVCIEGGVNHPINTPEKLLRLVKEVNHANLQVIFDLANYITLENIEQHQTILEQALKDLAPYLQVVHVKDFAVINGRIEFVPIGEGHYNFNTLFEILKEIKPNIYCLLEETKIADFQQAKAYLEKCGAKTLKL